MATILSKGRWVYGLYMYHVWFVVWRHQAISWNNFDQSPMGFCGIQMRSILQQEHLISIVYRKSLKVRLQNYSQISRRAKNSLLHNNFSPRDEEPKRHTVKPLIYGFNGWGKDN